MFPSASVSSYLHLFWSPVFSLSLCSSSFSPLYFLDSLYTLSVCSFSLRFLSVSSCLLSSVRFFLGCLSSPWFVAFSGFYKAREWPLFERSCLKIMGHVRSCHWEESRLLATISWPPKRVSWRVMGSCTFPAKPVPGMR